MMQPYGAASTRVPDTVHHNIDDNEGSALLGNSSASRPKEGRATIVSSVSNLSNTIMGSGMLTFPLAMASAGIIPGIATCAFSGLVGGFGLYLLARCARFTPHRRSSFFAVAEITFPQAALFFDAAIAIKCFGVSISYLIIIKSLMPNVVASLYHDLTSPDTTPPDWALSGHTWITLIMLLLGPLSFLRKINSFRHASYVALFSVVYLVIIVITCYFRPLQGTPPRGEVYLVHFTPSFVSTFPVQVFGFTCAQNIFPIYNELRGNSQERLNTVIGVSIGSAVIIYEIIGVFGYLTFGSNVGANIVAMYPSTSLFIAVGQLAIVILIMFSYPLQVHPCRNCLDKIFHTGSYVKQRPTEDDEEFDEHGDGDMPFLKHTLLTAAIVVFGFMIAYNMDNLQMVLSFVGSTGSTTISFILPGLFFWKLAKEDASISTSLRRSAVGLLLYGCFSLCVLSNYGCRCIHRSCASLVSFPPPCPPPHQWLPRQTLPSPPSLFNPLPLASSPSDAPNVHSPSRSDSDPLPDSDSTGSNNVSALPDVDPQIVEALKSKDRIYVLKLGEQMEGLINDRRSRIDLMPNTSYQRLLVHRCSTYYKLAPETDPITKLITVLLTLESGIPVRRIADLVPAQSPTQPTFKIMRRSPIDRQRPKPHSQAGSVAGEDPELSDPEPSEAGSLGGRSNATGSSKKHKTIAEREAAYNEARSRIFMNFDEKERGKEKDISASSSTVSLTSGSVTSACETSSTGDMDDSVSSPTTESEWSGPVVRDKKDGRRSNGSSSRSLRSTGPSFNGSTSSRDSRAPSPSSFKYPTLYEPSPAAVPCDVSQAPAPPLGYGNPYMYPYPQPAPTAPNFIPPYHYYPAYPYPHLTLRPPSRAQILQILLIPIFTHLKRLTIREFTFLMRGIHHHLPTLLLSTDPFPPPALQLLPFLPSIRRTRSPSHPMDPIRCLTIPHHLRCNPCNHPRLQHRTKHPTLPNIMDHTTRILPIVRIPELSVNSLPQWQPKPRGAPPARSAWSYGPGIGMGGFGVNWQ
ncbi:transmembrane amino acid transporter protein-domain-containing protein [Chiua virens]|nr:transmembrane amino acid transporter protein-domain-containing protein [Chiua virens]